MRPDRKKRRKRRSSTDISFEKEVTARRVFAVVCEAPVWKRKAVTAGNMGTVMNKILPDFI